MIFVMKPNFAWKKTKPHPSTKLLHIFQMVGTINSTYSFCIRQIKTIENFLSLLGMVCSRTAFWFAKQEKVQLERVGCTIYSRNRV